MVMFIFECFFPVLEGMNPNKVMFLVPDREHFIQVITCVFIRTTLQFLPTHPAHFRILPAILISSKGVVVVGDTINNY